MTIKTEEYKCKHCGCSLLLTEEDLKDDSLYCPSCNTKFVGTTVTFLSPKKIMADQEKKVDILIKLMCSGKDTINFKDFGEPQFNVMRILQEKTTVLSTALYDILFVGNYIYLWKGDSVVFLASKKKMQEMINLYPNTKNTEERACCIAYADARCDACDIAET